LTKESITAFFVDLEVNGKPSLFVLLAADGSVAPSLGQRAGAPAA
jgi:hypothetical protein